MNKIVISTFSTGSAISLIENGINGYLYESTNSKELAKLLDHCILKTSSEKVEFSKENSSQEIKLNNALFQNLKVFS